MTAPGEHGVNVPLLRKVLEHVTAHPEEWEQGEWVAQWPCGTVACIAGHAVIEAGHDLEWSKTRDWTVRTAAGESVPDVAGRELGLVLGAHGEHRLFNGENELHDVWRIASELTHGEIEVPADLPGGTL